MKFGNLGYLWLLWLIPALALFYVYAFRARRRALQRFCADQHLLARLIPEVSWTRRRYKALLVVVALTLMLVALLRPRWGFHWEDVRRVGVDLIVAIDVSTSMNAQDIEPSRLERAKREVRDLVRLLEGDRIGLLAFAGEAFMQCPLTLDYGATELFLDNLGPELISTPGTSLGSAIRLAVRSFKTQAKNSKALILITDGEDHEGEPLQAAAEAKQAGVRIFTIGVGKEGGAPIPSPEGGFKKDDRGEMILTRLDETTLQKIALETGGSYVRSVSGDMDLEKIYLEDIKQRMEKQELSSARQKKWEERFQLLLALALLALVAETMLSERRNKTEVAR